MGAEFQVKLWEVRKQKVYGDDSCPNQLQSQSSPGGLGGAAGVEGRRDDKFGEGKLYCVCRVSVGACVDACTCTCGCKCKCDNVHSCMVHVHVCVAPPIIVGAWPMAGTLWQLFDHYSSHQPQPTTIGTAVCIPTRVHIITLTYMYTYKYMH